MQGVDRFFERMVHEHKDRVFAASLAMTGNRHDAEDVAQDTFLRAYRALGTYSPERIRDLKERAWLHRITVNVVRRSEEHTSELQSQSNLVCRLLLEKKKKTR